MSKTLLIANILNALLLLLLIASVIGFLSFGTLYGVFLAAVTAAIALGVYKHWGLAYFAAAAWGLACYQLAKEGYEFQVVKHQVMTLGFIVIPVALFLHEKLAKPRRKNASESVTSEQDSHNMPQ